MIDPTEGRRLRPIPGAPTDAPIPDFPTKSKSGPQIAEQVRAAKSPSEAKRVRAPDSIPGANEIGVRLEQLKERERYGDKIALESMLEAAKLLRIMTDVHGYRGKAYELFAKARGINRSDAYLLWHLGPSADDALARCEASARTDPNYEWPSWRSAARKVEREQREGTDEKSDTPKREKPIDKLRRDKQHLEAELKAATQQIRNEQAKHKATGDKLKAAEDERDWLRAEVALLRKQLPEPPSAPTKPSPLWPAPTRLPFSMSYKKQPD